MGLVVYEEEEGLFFEDMSAKMIQDDVFARLLTFPNVLITGHQGFFTKEALEGIARTTIANLSTFEQSGRSAHQLSAVACTAVRGGLRLRRSEELRGGKGCCRTC